MKNGIGDKGKRRFRYLFRRENRVDKEQPKGSEDMGYIFPDVGNMSTAEIDREIKVRVKSLQEQGILPTEILEDIDSVLDKTKKQEIKKPTMKQVLKRPEFKPKFFIKRKDKNEE